MCWLPTSAITMLPAPSLSSPSTKRVPGEAVVGRSSSGFDDSAGRWVELIDRAVDDGEQVSRAVISNPVEIAQRAVKNRVVAVGESHPIEAVITAIRNQHR